MGAGFGPLDGAGEFDASGEFGEGKMEIKARGVTACLIGVTADYESSKAKTEASLPPLFIPRSPRNLIPAVPPRARAGCRLGQFRRRGGCAAPRGRGRRARLRRATVRTRRCSGRPSA